MLRTADPIEEGLSHDLGGSTLGDSMFFVNGAPPPQETGGLGETEINGRGNKRTGGQNEEPTDQQHGPLLGAP